MDTTSKKPLNNLAIISLSLVGLLASPLGLTEERAETLVECAKIQNSEERVACYDRLAGRVEKKLEEQQQGSTRDRVEKKNQVIAEEILGSEAPSSELYSLTIEKILRDRNRRVVYQTTDGRRFRRSSGTQSSFKAGDTLKMEEGFLGAVFLVSEDGKRIKVQEIH